MLSLFDVTVENLYLSKILRSFKSLPYFGLLDCQFASDHGQTIVSCATAYMQIILYQRNYVEINLFDLNDKLSIVFNVDSKLIDSIWFLTSCVFMVFIEDIILNDNDDRYDTKTSWETFMACSNKVSIILASIFYQSLIHVFVFFLAIC